MNVNTEGLKFPSQPDKEGWFYESETNFTLGIETREDEQENAYRRVRLTKGRTAVLRELTSTESKKGAQIAGNSPEKLVDAYVALCATITDRDGKPVKFVMEDLDGWKAKDTNKLQVACNQLNF